MDPALWPGTLMPWARPGDEPGSPGLHTPPSPRKATWVLVHELGQGHSMLHSRTFKSDRHEGCES